MAKPVQIPIEVVDKFSRQFSEMEKRLDSITKSVEKQQSRFNVLAADVIIRYGRDALGAVVNFGRQAIDSYAQQEAANKKLQVAMQNLGVFTDAAFRKQLQFAESLQATTTFSDDAITRAQALLTSFGLYGDKLNQTTKAVLDLATAQGIDLHSAAMLVGKAFTGETGTLSRYGLAVSEAGTRGERFEQVLAQIQRRFGGAAAADTQTFAGRVKQLENNFDDLKEKIGKELLPIAEQWVSWLNKSIDLTLKLSFGEEKTAQLADKNAEALRSRLEAAKSYYTAILQHDSRSSDQAIKTEAEILRLSAAYEKLRQLGKLDPAKSAPAPGMPTAPEPTDRAAIELERKLADETMLQEFALAEQARIRIERGTMTNQELEDLEAQHLARKLELSGQAETAEEVLRVRRLEREKQINAQRVANFQSTLSTIATLSTAKNKVLAGIGKAAGISQATVDTFVAANRALASAPPPYNFILAGLVTTAGLANVARIAGVELAEGAVVQARPGGTAATIGEAGDDEAVIPLNNSRATQRIAAALGGGGSRSIQISFGDINVNLMGPAPAGTAERRSVALQLGEELRAATTDAIEAALLTVQLANRFPLRAV